MRLKFKEQQYQLEAVDNTVRVFNGQPNNGMLEYVIDKGKTYVIQNGKKVPVSYLDFDTAGFKNSDIVLTREEILENIHKVQTESNIKLSNDLVDRLGHCQLDIEMETGTGKTYVYTRTIFELNKRYGWSKFIIVVPSIAIREGVSQSLSFTEDHFMEIYGKKIRYFIYDSNNLSIIDTEFSQSNEICVMIINTQAFNTMKEDANNKAARIINSQREEFGYRKPIDVIAANRPIVILDEPQKMGGTATQASLARFKPLFTLNYSATHKEAHNPVYVLDALDAYNKKLVKKIEVVGFELKNLHGTDKYIYLEDIILSHSDAPKARLGFEVQAKSTGKISRIFKNLYEGDSLYYESNELEQYRDFTISDIHVDTNNAAFSFVEFSNGRKLFVKDIIGDVTAEHKARIQIRETIKAHFRKESTLFHKGIKTLSLFFLDEVANYRKYDEEGEQILGRYGEIFEEEYKIALNEAQNLFDPEYMSYLGGISVQSTHTGYFSIDKKNRAVNSEVKRGSDISDDISAYELILKNKSALLDINRPERFIFSHSALREGWDNPNVFQICALRQSNSVSQKRQEVGRGLRICVNGKGERMDAELLGEDVHTINKLTVIASEGYASFVSDLQTKIKEDLYDRPTKADLNLFKDTFLFTEAGEKVHISEADAQEIIVQLRMNGYITKKGEVTDKFREDLKAGTLPLFEDNLEKVSKAIYTRVQTIFDDTVIEKMIENGGTPQTPENKLNDNKEKKEFKELWKRINHKYAYTCEFDSEELIKKCVEAIDADLQVTQLAYTTTRGEQKDTLRKVDFTGGDIMGKGKSNTEVLQTAVVSNVRYDVIGKIAQGATLTRRTVAEILTKISPAKFLMYKANPEEFISKVTQYIREQKSSIIVEHIEYNQIEGSYDMDIFTQEKHKSMDKAFKANKSIVDYVFTDGNAEESVERKFVEKLEEANEVVVYAKLPKGFHIPTPMGNYSPDWAIAFEEGKVKHVYFVAETKGSMSSLQLREIEKNKIKCATKLFERLSRDDVKFSYGKVDNFETLLNLVK
jgi:type III restriction enzyme